MVSGPFCIRMQFVIVHFKTASLSDDFGVRTHSKSFSQKFKNTPKSR